MSSTGMVITSTSTAEATDDVAALLARSLLADAPTISPLSIVAATGA